MSGTIYLFTFPNGKRYVGQTRCGLEKRLASHRHRAYAKSRTQGAAAVVYAAIRKYGWPEVTILGRYAVDELDQRERDFIVQLDTLLPAGYNMTAGGDLNPMLTEAGRASFEKSIRNPERLAKIAAAGRGRNHQHRTHRTPEFRARMSALKLGKPNIPERGAAFAAKLAGRKHYDGAPCRRCGDTWKYTSNSTCVKCTREANSLRRRNELMQKVVSL